MAKAESKRAGKLSISDMRKLINKKAGQPVAHDLQKENPTEVRAWIPTGSRWLNSIICRGKYAGIPVGKISEIAGLSASGKSYMAAQVAGNAQKMGMDVIYFDSESAIDPEFLSNAGCDVEDLLYIQAKSVEFVLETIEELLASNENQMLFIWDSLAMTPAESDIEGDYNPLSSMAVVPRILSKGFKKLTVPIANSQSTLLILNQLKTNITSNIAEARLEPYFTPGGKAPVYAYSMRIWLTARRGKASYIYDDKGFRVGTEVKAKIKKSRFGSDARECTFKIIWAGEDVQIRDEESWLQAIKSSPHLTNGGAWFTLKHKDGSEDKFQSKTWIEKLKDEKFKHRVFELMEEEVILRFERKDAEAKEFYDIDGESE
tara:strand:- start:122 stop:1243 length:1122 start_codon:yes stop_codon:yes gene_type:complete